MDEFDGREVGVPEWAEGAGVDEALLARVPAALVGSSAGHFPERDLVDAFAHFGQVEFDRRRGVLFSLVDADAPEAPAVRTLDASGVVVGPASATLGTLAVPADSHTGPLDPAVENWTATRVSESQDSWRCCPTSTRMRDEEEIREQYEFLKEQLDDENMNHSGVRQMFTYYKRALGWVLEEEYI